MQYTFNPPLPTHRLKLRGKRILAGETFTARPAEVAGVPHVEEVVDAFELTCPTLAECAAAEASEAAADLVQESAPVVAVEAVSEQLELPTPEEPPAPVPAAKVRPKKTRKLPISVKPPAKKRTKK